MAKSGDVPQPDDPVHHHAAEVGDPVGHEHHQPAGRGAGISDFGFRIGFHDRPMPPVDTFALSSVASMRARNARKHGGQAHPLNGGARYAPSLFFYFVVAMARLE